MAHIIINNCTLDTYKSYEVGSIQRDMIYGIKLHSAMINYKRRLAIKHCPLLPIRISL